VIFKQADVASKLYAEGMSMGNPSANRLVAVGIGSASIGDGG
jgi:hypothetical protein